MNTMHDLVKNAVKGLLVAAAVSGAGVLQAEPVVVVHADLGVDSLQVSEVRRLFLGASQRVAGTSAVLAVQQQGSTHENFVHNVLAKSPQQFTNYWRKIVFSGKGKMPATFDSDQAVIEFVARTPGAVGYVDAGAVTASVKRVPLR